MMDLSRKHLTILIVFLLGVCSLLFFPTYYFSPAFWGESETLEMLEESMSDSSISVSGSYLETVDSDYEKMLNEDTENTTLHNYSKELENTKEGCERIDEDNPPEGVSNYCQDIEGYAEEKVYQNLVVELYSHSNLYLVGEYNDAVVESGYIPPEENMIARTLVPHTLSSMNRVISEHYSETCFDELPYHNCFVALNENYTETDWQSKTEEISEETNEPIVRTVAEASLDVQNDADNPFTERLAYLHSRNLDDCMSDYDESSIFPGRHLSESLYHCTMEHRSERRESRVF